MDDFIEETKIKGVVVIKRPIFGDPRGFFRETFRKEDLEKRLGFSFEIVQANHSRSKQNVLRGVHRAPWHKLITVTKGQVQQVVIDLREDSPTFGKVLNLSLGESNLASVFVPAFCGNAYLVLSETADYVYLTNDYWEKGKEIGLKYNDPDLNIKWDSNNPILSPKDLENKSFKEIFSNKP